MKHKEFYSSLIVVVAILAITFAVTSVAPTAEERPPIKIGIAFDMSGAFASNGEAELPAVKMFFEEKGMKIAGRKIELLVEDAATSPNVTLTKTKKLVEMDKVNLMLVTQNTAAGYAIRDYIHQNKVPTVGIAFGAAHTRRLYSPYFFRVSPSTYQYSYESAKWFSNYGFKRIIYIANDMAPTRESLEAVKKGLEATGGEVVQVVWVPLGNKDFGPYIPQLKIEQADAILLRVWGVAAVRFMKQWTEYGKKGMIPIIGGGSTLDEGIALPAMGLAAEGAFSSSYTCATTDLPTNKKFVNTYKAATGMYPGTLAYIAYLVAQTAYQAMEKVNGDVENKDKLVKALQSVRFTTPMGSDAYFDERNGMVWDMIFMQAKKTNGEVHLFEIGRVKNVKDPIKLFP